MRESKIPLTLKVRKLYRQTPKRERFPNKYVIPTYGLDASFLTYLRDNFKEFRDRSEELSCIYNHGGKERRETHTTVFHFGPQRTDDEILNLFDKMVEKEYDRYIITCAYRHPEPTVDIEFRHPFDKDQWE